MTNNKLYVGNLTFNASENGLREIFSEAGEVRETAIITDKNNRPIPGLRLRHNGR